MHIYETQILNIIIFYDGSVSENVEKIKRLRLVRFILLVANVFRS